MPNLVERFRYQVARWGDRTALRYRSRGVYRDISWRRYAEVVDLAARGWIRLGLPKGERVTLLSENRAAWLMADVGVLAAGLADVPCHAPLSAEQVRFQVEHSQSRWILLSGPAQAAKVAACAHQLGEVEGVISFDPIAPIPGKRTMSFAALLQLGRTAPREVALEQATREAAIAPSDLATILYTSGTTGNPKGVMLTHGNLGSNMKAVASVVTTQPSDVYLSWLPYSHSFARMCDHCLHLEIGQTLCLSESAETVVRDLAEAHPMSMSAVPRFYEKLLEALVAVPEAARPAALRRIFGPRLRWITSGGAPLPLHVGRAFQAAGIEILEGYGLTETSPVITCNRPDANKIGTVGLPVPGVSVKIADDGEILTKGPHVMAGYWRQPEDTAAILHDGWLATGDIGSIDGDGFLKITDRKKDIFVNSGGKNIAPQVVEALVTSDEAIDQAVVYGDARPFLAALIVPNLAVLARAAKAEGWPGSGPSEWVRAAAAIAWFQARIDTRLADVAPWERVRAIILLDAPFTLEGNEMTTTMKVRRREVIRHHAAALEALYARPVPASD